MRKTDHQIALDASRLFRPSQSHQRPRSPKKDVQAGLTKLQIIPQPIQNPLIEVRQEELPVSRPLHQLCDQDAQEPDSRAQLEHS